MLGHEKITRKNPKHKCDKGKACARLGKRRKHRAEKYETRIGVMGKIRPRVSGRLLGRRLKARQV